MRGILSLPVLAAALISPAAASDLPSRLPPPVYLPPVAAFSWSGIYAGVNLGGAIPAQGGRRETLVGVPAGAGVFAGAAGNPAPGLLGFPGDRGLGGAVGGGQVGFNYQFAPGRGLVVGAEADAQGIDFRVSRRRVVFATTDGLGGVPGTGGILPGTRIYDPNGVSGLDILGTVRGRVGYALDRTLVYATGGLAYGTLADRRFGGSAFSDAVRVGWTLGGGVEVALPTDSILNVLGAAAVTFKAEGLYVRLERDNRGPGLFALNPAGAAVGLATPGVALVGGPAGFRPETGFALVRAGLNYKLGWY